MILFLHGFLGSKEDWDGVIAPLSSEFECIAVDLPAHGSVPFTRSFVGSILDFIDQRKLKNITLVGYSMGGRIALELAEKHPSLWDHVIILSAHPGLHSETERITRWETDLKWIELLQSGSMTDFLEKWYDQPLFASLKGKKELFEKIVTRRGELDPHQIAAVLNHYSIAKQPPISSFHPSTLLMYGEEDGKYQTLYSNLSDRLKVCKIENAGHAIHLENPNGCALAIQGEIECKHVKPQRQPSGN